MSQSMTAVILAAGRGARLRPLTRLTPKPLVPVGDKPILGRILEALAGLGIRSVTLVVGFRRALVERYAARHSPELDLTFLENPVYATTNTLYSLWVARRAVEGRSFLLIDGDLVVEPKLLEAVVKQGGNAVVCDRSVTLDGEAVRAYGRANGKVARIGKNIARDGISFGESIGLARISVAASRRLFEACRQIIRGGGRREYYEAAFQRLIGQGIRFVAVDTHGARWVEVDTAADLRRARALFDGRAGGLG